MRKFIIVAIIASLLSGSMVMFLTSTASNRNSNQEFQRATDELSNKLANDPQFIASVQSRAEQSLKTANLAIKGDKGDLGAGGNPGANGSPGASGTQGITGQDGAQGPKGDIGETGIQGPSGAIGGQGPQGELGEQGLKGETGAVGDQGIQGEQGLQGAQGLQGTQGESGVATVSATGLSYNSSTQDIALTSGYNIPLTTSTTQWNTAHSWGDHSAAGYAVLNGKAGGQVLVGGTNANNTLIIQANSSASNNTSTSAGIVLRVGNSGSISAITVRNDGNVGIGTATPGGKLTVAGDITITTHGGDSIKPFQFVQVTGLGDNPSLTSFSGTSYSVADWNPAVVGFMSGGSCGTNWSNGTLTGLRYWWENDNGLWRLVVDMSGPNDGCNTVQVMFVRKEVSVRTNYGF